MEKYLAWVETKYNYETWLLIDSPTLEKAEELAKSLDGFVELRACKKIVSNEDEGISHIFTAIKDY